MYPLRAPNLFLCFMATINKLCKRTFPFQVPPASFHFQFYFGLCDGTLYSDIAASALQV